MNEIDKWTYICLVDYRGFLKSVSRSLDDL